MPRARFDYLSSRQYALVLFPLRIGAEDTYYGESYEAAFYGYYGETLDVAQLDYERSLYSPQDWIPDAELEVESTFAGSATMTGSTSADGLFGTTGWLIALAYEENTMSRTYYYAVVELDGRETYQIESWTELPTSGRIVPPLQ